MRAWIVGAVACALAGCWVVRSTPPAPPPTCTAVGDHVARLIATSPESSAAERDAIVQRCTDDHWSADVMTCMLGETARDRRHCKLQLSSAQRGALATELAAARAPQPPVACVAFDRMLVALEQCPMLPPHLRQVYELQRTMATGAWLTHDLPPEMINEICRASLEALDPNILAVCGVR